VAVEAGRVRAALAPGKYALTITRAGYARDASTFEVVDGQTRRWSIALRRSKSRPVTRGSAVPTGSATPVVPPPPPPSAPPPPKGDGDGVRDPFAK
jgi:hypothetical protein